MWLSEDHPQLFTDKARNLHLSDSEVVSIEEKGRTSYCSNIVITA